MTDSGTERAARRIVRELVESATDETFENHVDHVVAIISGEIGTQIAYRTFDEWLEAIIAINPAGVSEVWERGARAGWRAREESVCALPTVPDEGGTR